MKLASWAIRTASGRRLVEPAEHRRVVDVDQLVDHRRPAAARDGGRRRGAPSPPAGRGRRPGSACTAAGWRGPRDRTAGPCARCSTRSSGPPLAGATTGTPLACASCTVWQNVSDSPVWTKTSREAKARGQLLAAQHAGERRVRQVPLQPPARRAVADDDQPGPGDGGDLDQAAYLLLERQPTDVPDDHVAAAGHCRCSPALRRSGRTGPARPRAATGAGRRRPARTSWSYADARGHQRAVGTPVDAAHPPRDHRVGADPVVARERRDVGLVDGDGGQVEPRGCPQPRARRGRRGTRGARRRARTAASERSTAVSGRPTGKDR